MVGTTLTSPQSEQVINLLTKAARSSVDTLSSLIGADIRMGETDVIVIDVPTLAKSFTSERAIAIGGLHKDYEGKHLRVIFESTDAATISGQMMMMSDSGIKNARASQKLTGDDFEAFGEVANIIFSGIDSLMSETLGDSISVRVDRHAVCAPGGDTDPLGELPMIALKTSITIGDYPPTDLLVGVDVETANVWNGEEIQEAATFLTGGEEPIEEVPTRGTIACYLADPEPYDLVRRACRRIGLDIDHRPASEVPNPAAYRGRLVLVDIPIRGDRRFGWCKRLKDYDESCRVLMMLRSPSRQRVVNGFLAKPDVLVGWPIDEIELAAKLDEAFVKTGAAPAGAADADSAAGDGDNSAG